MSMSAATWRSRKSCSSVMPARSSAGADRDFAPLADLMKLQLVARGAEAGVAAAEAFRIHPSFKRTRAW